MTGLTAQSPEKLPWWAGNARLTNVMATYFQLHHGRYPIRSSKSQSLDLIPSAVVMVLQRYKLPQILRLTPFAADGQHSEGCA